MKKTIIAVMAAGALTLLACASGGEPGISGTITDKDIEYRKGRPSKGISCYELEITDAAGDAHDFCVTKDLYDKYSEGDKYPK